MPLFATAYSRRHFITNVGGAILGGQWLPWEALAQSREPGEPHFFLHVYFKGGWDQEYMFDPRPRDFVSHGLAKNYLPESAVPITWQAENQTITAAEPMAPLYTKRHLFSILRGVHMSPGFDGHDQNTSLLYTGSEFGGPYFGLERSGNTPLKGIRFGYNRFSEIKVTNIAKSVKLSAGDIASLTWLAPASDSGTLAKARQLAVDELARSTGADAQGQWHKGQVQLKSGLASAATMGQRLQQVNVNPDLTATASDIQVILECFANGITTTADLMIRENLDAHDPATAQTAPGVHRGIATKIATILDALTSTRYDATRSFADVTTFMFTSEFGRTYKQSYNQVQATGTDHNSFCNTYLIGGKGVRCGHVYGASDLDQISSSGAFLRVSDAHRQKDAELVKPFGKPIDLVTGRVHSHLPATYQNTDYLAYYNITNTLLSIWGAPQTSLWTIPGTRQKAPLFQPLLAT